MKKFKIVLFIFVGLLIFGCSTAYKSLIAQTPDLTSISDGIYHGNFNMSSTSVKATLDVIVQNHQIININILEHYCSPIGKKAEIIIDSIIEHQSLDVDIISGATASSKTLLKAVENALE